MYKATAAAAAKEDEAGFNELVEDFWARAWVLSMGARPPKKEVFVRFRNFVEVQLRKSGAFPPQHWDLLVNKTDSELYELLIEFIEYLAEW